MSSIASLNIPVRSATVNVMAIPAFADNYIWAIVAHGHCIVVDPGDAAPVFEFLSARQLTLDAILITHHHADHTGGIVPLLSCFAVPVYGPQNPSIKGISRPLGKDDRFEFPTVYDCPPLTVIAVPGHTLDHIAFTNARWLFSGDTLFAAGCGRLFEGTPAQMYASLQMLCALPPEVAVYCAHEYTLSNLRFALNVEPDNAELQAREFAAIETRKANQPTVPSSLALELATNPFLRTEAPEIVSSIQHYAEKAGLPIARDSVDRFALLRQMKNEFRG